MAGKNSTGQNVAADKMLQNIRTVLTQMPHLGKVNTLRFGDQMNIEMLAAINELLPELVVLETQCQNDSFSKYQGLPINFKKVTELTVHISGSGLRPTQIPISFDQLQHLVLNGYSRHADEWTQFIVQNVQLRSLVLVPGLCILTEENMDNNLMKFATMLPKLSELFVYGDFISSPERLIQFVQESKALVKLHLRFFYGDELMRTSFASAMTTNNWNVTRQRVKEQCNDLICERQLN